MHFRAVITDKVTPTLKCKQNKQSNTAILRILEEEKQAGRENAAHLLESTFSKVDSALRDKSAILRGGLAHYRLDKSLRPPLENANFSSQNKGHRSAIADVSLEILESQSGLVQGVSTQAGFFSKKPTPKQQPKDSRSEVPFLSLRENPQGFSWQSISAQADSKQNAQNLTTPQAEAKVDSSTATTLSQPAKDSRSFDKEAQNVSEPQAEAKVDSSNDYSASAKFMDCHADFQSARNDDKAQNLNNSAQDSRISKETSAIAERCPLFCDEKPLLFKRVQGRILGVCNRSTRAEIKGLSRKAESTNNAQNVFCSHATRRQDFCDKNGALQGESKARTWACVTADSPQQSPFLAKKPTPKPRKAESTSQAESPLSLKAAYAAA